MLILQMSQHLRALLHLPHRHDQPDRRLVLRRVPCHELRWMDQVEWRQLGTSGSRCSDRFRAAREQVERARVAAAAAAEAARPKKLRAKKQAAQAAAAVAAERKRDTLYNELDDRCLARMGWEDYGSDLRGLQPPTSGALRLQPSPRRSVWGC